MGPSHTDRSWPELKTCWRRAPRPVRRRIGPTRQEQSPRLGLPLSMGRPAHFLGRAAHGQRSASEEEFTLHGSDATGAMCAGGPGRTLGAVTTPLAPRGHEPGPLAIRSRKLAIRLLLEHEHIYTDWNIDQLADTLREILDSESER